MIRLIMYSTGGPTDGTGTIDHTARERVDAFANEIKVAAIAKAA